MFLWHIYLQVLLYSSSSTSGGLSTHGLIRLRKRLKLSSQLSLSYRRAGLAAASIIIPIVFG
jgi:hypothetical protein